MPSTSLIKQSPVTVLQSASATGGAVLAFLVAHGVIPTDVAKNYGPYFVIVWVAVFAVWTWRHTFPWHKAKSLVDQLEQGHLPDADLARVDALVRDALGDFLDVDPLGLHVTGDAHPDATAVGAPPPGAGMSAGAPTPTPAAPAAS